jgi:O-antigen ligase
MFLSTSPVFEPWHGKKAITNNLHFLLTCLVAVTLPVNVDSIQFGSIAIVLLFVNWLVQGDFSAKFQQFSNAKAAWCVVLFYMLHVVWLLGSANMPFGLFDLEKKLAIFVLPVVLFSKPLSIRQFEVLVLSFIICCFCLGIVGTILGYVFLQELIARNIPVAPEHIVTYCLNMPRVYFSLYVMFCLACMYCLYKKYQFQVSGLVKWAAVFVAVVFIAFLFLMASRMNLILFVLFFFSIGFYELVLKRKRYILAFIALGIGVVFFAIAFTQIPHVKSFMSDFTKKVEKNEHGLYNSVALRTFKLNAARNILADNWVLGIGTGDVQDELNEQYRKMDFEIGFTDNLDTHNQYLQTWIGLGVIGLLVLLAVYTTFLQHSLQVRNLLAVLFIAHFAIASMSEALLTTQKGIVYFALFFPLTYVGIVEKKEKIRR